MKNELEALLIEVKAAYDKSDINKAGLQYSLITGSLQKNQPLIIGFNWGANDTTSYEPQKEIKADCLCLEDLGSIKRVIRFCKQHFGDDFLDRANQTNFCFFRSKSEGDISQKDLELCQPIFDKLLTLLTPSIVLCFSGQLRDYLCSPNRENAIKNIKEKSILFARGGKKVTSYVVKGYINGSEIAFLPHPNSPIPGKVRNEAWEFIRH